MSTFVQALLSKLVVCFASVEMILRWIARKSTTEETSKEKTAREFP